MQLLAQHIYQHFQKKHHEYVFADELMVKIQRIRECFLGKTLPLPTVEVIAAWKDVPNVTVQNTALSVKTELALLRAPPPTPTGFALDEDGPTSGDPSSDGSPDEEGWLLVDTTSTTPDVVVPHAIEGSVTSDDDAMSRRSDPDQPSDLQSNEEDPSQSTESSSLSSDQESLSSSSAGSPTPVGFDNMVHQWLVDYRGRGRDACVESLIAFGAISVGAALLAARIARAIVREVSKTSCTEGQDLHNAVRFLALAAFKQYWGVVSSYSKTVASENEPTTWNM